jgi:hypothetical protein
MTVKMRVRNNYRVHVGAQTTDPKKPAFFGDEDLTLSTQFKEYTINLITTRESGAWRLPYFGIGANTNKGWIEFYVTKIEAGNVPTPLVPPAGLLLPTRVTADGWAIAWSCEAGDMATFTMPGDRQINAPRGTPFDGQKATVRLRQDAKGGRKIQLSRPEVFCSLTLQLLNALNLLTFSTRVLREVEPRGTGDD